MSHVSPLWGSVFRGNWVNVKPWKQAAVGLSFSSCIPPTTLGFGPVADAGGKDEGINAFLKELQQGLAEGQPSAFLAIATTAS